MVFEFLQVWNGQIPLQIILQVVFLYCTLMGFVVV